VGEEPLWIREFFGLGDERAQKKKHFRVGREENLFVRVLPSQFFFLFPFITKEYTMHVLCIAPVSPVCTILSGSYNKTSLLHTSICVEVYISNLIIFLE